LMWSTGPGRLAVHDELDALADVACGPAVHDGYPPPACLGAAVDTMSDAGAWEVVVTGIELVLAALSAGAVAAGSTAANGAVTDAYERLKGLLSRRLTRRGSDAGVLDERSGVIPVRLYAALAACGAGADQEVLMAAQHLLHLVDAHVTGTSSRVRIGSNLGAVGTFYAPVTITNQAPGGGTADPPAEPGSG
jgi:hypothetical protein